MSEDEKFDFRMILKILEVIPAELRKHIFCIGGSTMALNPIFSKDPHLTKDIDFVIKKYEFFKKIVGIIPNKFPQIRLPDYDLDETLKRGLPYTLVFQKLKIDLFGEKIYGIRFTTSIENRCKHLTLPVKTGMVTVNYLSDNDLLLFKLYASLSDTKQFDHVMKILDVSEEIDWNIILTEAKKQDLLKIEVERNSRYKTPSIHSSILQIIQDLRKKGYKIKI
ncbi:MAG: hypothetical protein ACTSRS_06900 [Candidatus Helarchaeota archaeon]